jgi:hypothetical protein
MDISYRLIRGAELIKVTVTGEFDRQATEEACATLATKVRKTEPNGVLLDLRDFGCDLSVAEVYGVCSDLTEFQPLYWRRIAVLVDGDAADRKFDLADFMSLCGRNRGLPIRAFTDKDAAVAWLESGATRDQ